jgi:Tfp pilus assembly protein PilF
MRTFLAPMTGLVRCGLLAALVFGASVPLGAAPRVPASDDVIVETLPAIAGWSIEERRLRQALAQHPHDEATAIAAARAYLELARTQGDARYAGYAMGALQAWDSTTESQTPPAVLVMRATVAQFLHDFDGAEATLKAALARQPDNAQAWITLATILRVRGRYAESDAACRALGRVGPALYGLACMAENAGLRGDHASARDALRSLLAEPVLQGEQRAETRQWLLTSLAEVEELAGRPTAAEAFYRQALQAERSGYLLLAYSDFLLAQKRPAEVPALLDKEPRSDAVLLRLAIAARQADSAEVARQDAEELQSRFDAAAQRPGNAEVHAREGALFALDVQGDARRALELARVNVRLQREPIDLLLLARAAAATNDEEARRELRALIQETGLRDARIDAVL